MNAMKKILSAVVVLAMVLALFPAVVMAQETEIPYKTYVSLGDSIPAGRGEFPQQTMRGFTRIEGVYNTLIADALGADFTPLGYCGFRTNEIRWMIDDDYEGDDDLFMGSQVRLEEPLRSQMRPVFKEALKNADIITLNIGSNDLMTYPLRRAVAGLNLAGLGGGSEMEDNVITRSMLGDPSAANDMVNEASAAGMVGTVITNLIDGVYDAYSMFLENYQYIVDYIYDVNPDATIVAVSLFNNVGNVKLTDQSVIELGRVFDGVFRAINTYMQFGVSHKGKYIYADVMGTETPQFEPILGGDLNKFISTAIVRVHPSLEGHAYMARKILQVIPDIPQSSLPFGDVPAREWYYEGVKYAYEHKLMVGSSESIFAPQGTATRAELATVLYSMSGRPSFSGSEPFLDVSDGDWFAPAVGWAYANGIVGGISSDTFAPNEPLTRAQMVLMLYRQAGSPEVKDPVSFKDQSSIAPEYSDAVSWAASEKVVGGFEDGTFRPNDSVTRAQMATMLSAYCK